MAAQAEEAFARSFLSTIGSQPVIYSDDYQQPPSNSLRKVPILPLELPPLPERQRDTAGQTSGQTLNVTIKSSKPAYSVSLTIDASESISTLKAQLAAQPGAPSVDAQRLLIKGKALADAKLLQEYGIKSGDTINLMLRPGVSWDPSAPAPTPAASTLVEEPLPIVAPQPTVPTSSESSSSSSLKAGGPRKHTRVPSLVLSPSPSNELEGGAKPIDINLTLDPAPNSIQTETLSAQHAIISNPEFWQRQLQFLRSEFPTEEDAKLVFEDFFRASKGVLTVSDIAKIRDTVGIVGMAGV